MSSLKSCCTIAPVDSTYQPVGTVENVGIHELPTYIVGPKDAKKAIVVLYDIFGLHNNTKQFCDVLANNCGYKVVMPDFFRGEPYKHEWMGDVDRLMTWIHKVGSLEVIQPQVEVVRQWLQEQGVVQGGLVGFCWGAKISVQLTALDSFFGGASLIHPSFVDVKDAENAGAPILALPSQNEPDMTEYMEVLAKKPFGDKCHHQRFDDMHHGFAAARGDWSDELNKKRATEAIQLTANFFRSVLTQ
ncbi:hypothetical protein INT45_002088 [Circinella minor]|uniref:Dienelactone hydrolase domain-containing protein n=1 Tax=Circinella minor TaxID=1195481 RepID=A0A8H7SFY0_9FUNG|nr:hypothetical protein INT45_002088 [Circinella minor]